MKRIYLDEFATTKVYPGVVTEMNKFMTENYGNPSSLHELGEKAFDEINKAREKLAKEIDARSWEIIFTSGGTESDNLAIQCLARAYTKKKIIISTIEHPAIMDVCNYMEGQGYEIKKIKVDKNGLLDMAKLENEIDDNTLLVSIIHVNNIIGTIQDLGKIGELCRKKDVLFHTDAVQSFGKLKIDVEKMNIDLLSASGHKLGGPKGIGFLYVREGVKISPLIYGGGQEKGLRSGTENVPGIVGFAKALELSKKIKKEKVRKLRDRLIEGFGNIDGRINGSSEKRIYNNVHVSFQGIESESLVYYLSKKGIYVSAGSACDSKKEKEEHVLKAIGLKEKDIGGSLRISLSQGLTSKDIDFVVKEIKKAVEKLRV